MSVEQIGLPGGELETIVESADVLLSFKKTRPLSAGKRKSYSQGDQFVSLLMAEYLQVNVDDDARMLENVRLLVQRLRPIGTCALQESFTFKLINFAVAIEDDSKLVGESPRIDIYKVENIGGQHEPYVGTVHRADFLAEDLTVPMTLADCEALTSVISNIRAVEQYRR